LELIIMKPGRSAVASPYSLVIDEAMDGYVSWREESAAVEKAYRTWLSAGREDRALAFAVYAAALDREERAASDYERLIARATAP
jgi:hypothetical protein